MTSATLETLFKQVLDAPSGRMIVVDQSPVTFAVVNDNGRAAIFVRVSLAPSQIVSDGQGFSVRTTRSGEDDFVQITSADQGLPSLFLKLAEFLHEQVSATRSAAECAHVLIRSIDEYRRFVGQRRGRLSESLVRGTFAELLFLRALIANGLNEEDAVVAWRGPWARAGLAIHDFTFADGRGVEVKSTHQPPLTVRVSSPNQLVPSQHPLDLIVLPIEDAPTDSRTAISFPECVQEMGASFFAVGPRAAERWDSALDALGLDISDDWYRRFRFVPGDWMRYEVRPGFPYLSVLSFPAGVLDVRYSLDLRQLAPFMKPFDELLHEMARN